MISEIGQFALILAAMVALYQAVFPLLAASRGEQAVARLAASASVAQALLVALAFVALTIAHGTSDFSVANVVQNSHTDKPFGYKLSGVWGNHEGSMLLWVLILAVYGAALGMRKTHNDMLKARTLAVQGAVAVAFLAFVIFTSNPFERVFPAPENGMGLNPLLQDPGLAIHPPFLYLGYVGFSIVFAFAIAGLITGEIDEAWARAVRPWALLAWVFLTIGIALGSWWAYYELGWGGFWAWDPVENASFMPWLAGTAFIHSVRVLEKRGALKVWTVLLAILAFSLSLVGTFLVRSGIITSVHAFAVDPTRGVFILLILAAVVGGSLLLFAVRAPTLTSRAGFAPVSREGAILWNNILMSASCVTVFVGTFYPLFVDVLSGERISVGAPYFNATFLPLMVILMAIIAPAAALAWKRGDLGANVKAAWPAGVVALVLAGLGLAFLAPRSVGAAFGVALAGWAGAGSLLELWRRAQVRASGIGETIANIPRLPRSFLGMVTAHMGIAVLAVGVIGAGGLRTEEVLYMQPGDSVVVGGYDVTLNDVVENEGPNYIAETARFSVARGEKVLNTIAAERRFYPVRGMQTTEAGIWTTFMGDLYLAVGERNPDRGQVVRAWYNPFAVWLWIGSAMIALGGALAAAPRRSPSKETSSATSPAPSKVAEAAS